MSPETRLLRQLARELALPVSVVHYGIECGLFPPGAPLERHRRVLRSMRRLMRDLEVNAAGAAVIVRLCHEIETLQHGAESKRMRELRDLETWFDGVWRELVE